MNLRKDHYRYPTHTCELFVVGTSARCLDELCSAPSHTHPINSSLKLTLCVSSSFTKRIEDVLTEITLNNGYLGSRNDEERSEMRYVV